MTTRYKYLTLIWLLQFVNYMDRICISVAAPTMMKSLRIDAGSFGIVLASFTFGYALMQIPGGYLADRFGAKAVLVMAPIAWSIFTGITGLATAVTALISIRILFGVSEGASNASCFKVVGDYFKPEDRSAANGVWLTALALGPACVAPMATWLLSTVGWRQLFFWMMLPGIIVALSMHVVLPTHTSSRKDFNQDSQEIEHTVRWAVLLSRPSSWLLFIGHLTFDIGYWGFVGWMPGYLALARHLDLKTLGYGSSVPYLCGFVGIVVIGWLGNVFFQHRPILTATCYLLAAISLFFTIYATTIVGCLCGLSAAAFFLFGGYGPYASVLLDLAPRDMRGAFAGFINTGGQIGGFIAPIVVGFIVLDTSSFTGGFMFMIGSLLVSTFCYAALRPYVLKVAQNPPLVST